MSSYAGVDYGLGTTNVDENGIRFGIISANELADEIEEGFESDYGSPSCPYCGATLNNEDELVCPDCGEGFTDGEQYGEEVESRTFDKEGYKVVIDSYRDVIILKSPWYTYAQFCSPCAPGAGNLSSPFIPTFPSYMNPRKYVKAAEALGFPKVYCFDRTWFNHNLPPYPIFSVDTNNCMNPEWFI